MSALWHRSIPFSLFLFVCLFICSCYTILSSGQPGPSFSGRRQPFQPQSTKTKHARWHERRAVIPETGAMPRLQMPTQRSRTSVHRSSHTRTVRWELRAHSTAFLPSPDPAYCASPWRKHYHVAKHRRMTGLQRARSFHRTPGLKPNGLQAPFAAKPTVRLEYTRSLRQSCAQRAVSDERETRDWSGEHVAPTALPAHGYERSVVHAHLPAALALHIPPPGGSSRLRSQPVRPWNGAKEARCRRSRYTPSGRAQTGKTAGKWTRRKARPRPTFFFFKGSDADNHRRGLSRTVCVACRKIQDERERGERKIGRKKVASNF